LAVGFLLPAAQMAGGQPDSPAEATETLARLEAATASIKSFHVAWDEAISGAGYASREGPTQRELWVVPGGYRYRVKGSQLNPTTRKLAPFDQEYIDDGQQYTSFSHDFNGKGARGAVVHKSGSNSPAIKMLAPILALQPFAPLGGGIVKDQVVSQGRDDSGRLVFRETRPNGGARLGYCGELEGRCVIQRVETIIADKLRYDLTIEYERTLASEVAVPRGWVLTKLGPDGSVDETFTSVVTKIEINPPLDNSILILAMPEGAAVTDATNEAKPAFAYVGPNSEKIELSRKEIFQTYQQVKQSRVPYYILYAAASATLILGAVIGMVWVFFPRQQPVMGIKAAPKSHRWTAPLRFSIRTMLIALTVSGGCLWAVAYATKDWRQREHARRELMACGAIHVGFQGASDPNWVSLRGSLLNANLANYPTVEYVDYADSAVSAQDLEVIAKLPHLQLLDLAHCDLPSQPGTILSKMQNICVLRLNGTTFDDADLLRLQSIDKLRAVDVKETLVTLKGVQEFRELRPDVTVRH
jgi:hypothetical protein